jgi:hypothetical protein
LLSHAEAPWSEKLVFEPLFSRRFASSRREQDLKRYPSSVRPIDLQFTGYRVGQLDAASAAGPFPARVDIGENALGLDTGFSAVTAIAGGGKTRWTGAIAGETIIPDGMTELRFQISMPEGARPRRTLRIESTTGDPYGPGGAQGRGVLLDWIEIRPLGPGAPMAN